MTTTLKDLTPEEKQVILDKGTERPFTGKYDDFFEQGSYNCKQCNSPLYRSEDKFPSHCGWPSFDDEIAGAIRHEIDADGSRTEIVCASCDGHLGHVFEGERLTEKNTRHCVNSVSMNFVSSDEVEKATDDKVDSSTREAYFAGGCFWGVEHLLQQQDGVESVVSGYMGGQTENPTYQEVCTMPTGHLEVVKVKYDADKISFTTLAQLFFEIHDPTQVGGQGPDTGAQYASAIFYNDEEEKQASKKLIDTLESKGYSVATKLLPMCPFWKAEEYHQDYYEKNGKQPYCHNYQSKF